MHVASSGGAYRLGSATTTHSDDRSDEVAWEGIATVSAQIHAMQDRVENNGGARLLSCSMGVATIWADLKVSGHGYL